MFCNESMRSASTLVVCIIIQQNCCNIDYDCRTLNLNSGSADLIKMIWGKNNEEYISTVINDWLLNSYLFL